LNRAKKRVPVKEEMQPLINADIAVCCIKSVQKDTNYYGGFNPVRRLIYL